MGSGLLRSRSGKNSLYERSSLGRTSVGSCAEGAWVLSVREMGDNRVGTTVRDGPPFRRGLPRRAGGFGTSCTAATEDVIASASAMRR